MSVEMFSMFHKRVFLRWMRIMISLSVGVVMLVFIKHALRKEAVRTELVRDQKESGLSLISAHGSKIYTVDFTNRSLREIKPSGNHGLEAALVSPNRAEVTLRFCPPPQGTQTP